MLADLSLARHASLQSRPTFGLLAMVSDEYAVWHALEVRYSQLCLRRTLGAAHRGVEGRAVTRVTQAPKALATYCWLRCPICLGYVVAPARNGVRTHASDEARYGLATQAMTPHTSSHDLFLCFIAW